MERNVPIFCLRNFKSSEVVENWKFLSQQIEDEQIAKKFSLVLNKMEKSRPIKPLGMVIQLGNAGKYHDVMKFIIEHEKRYSTVDDDTVDDDGFPYYSVWDGWDMTPIHLAARYGFTQSVERLKDKYDSPIDYIETSEDGRNPIHFAAVYGHLEIVKNLAKFADVPNAPDNNGTTPIHYAALEGHLEIVEFLTKFTECPNAPNNHGRTPIRGAAFSGHLEIIKFLTKFTEYTRQLWRDSAHNSKIQWSQSCCEVFGRVSRLRNT